MMQEIPEYAEIINTHFGKILALKNDRNQSIYYKENNKHIEQTHIDRLKKVIKDINNPVIVDVGANLGWFTLDLKFSNPTSKIIAFEPQKVLTNMLEYSIALNSFENITVHNIGLGHKDHLMELAVFDYNKMGNFGGISLGKYNGSKENIGQSPLRYQQIQVKKLDQFEFDRLDLLKVDIEGMELEFLVGAEITIKKHRPIIFIEFLKCDRAILKNTLKQLDYYIRETHDYNYLCFPVTENNDQKKEQ